MRKLFLLTSIAVLATTVVLARFYPVAYHAFWILVPLFLLGLQDRFRPGDATPTIARLA